MPAWIGVAVPLALSLLVCTLLAGRRLSIWRLAIAVGASQFFFHMLFVLGTFAPGAATGAGGHHGHGAMASLPADSSAALDAGAALMSHSDATMWLWHAIAAIATTAALHRGEATARALRRIAVRIVTWVRRRILVAGDALRPVVGPRAWSPFLAITRPADPPFLSVATRRGPPAAAAV